MGRLLMFGKKYVWFLLTWTFVSGFLLIHYHSKIQSAHKYFSGNLTLQTHHGKKSQDVAESDRKPKTKPKTGLQNKDQEYEQKWDSWLEALTDTADSTRTLFIAQVDEGFIDMAFSLYETSLKPHNITNFLFVGLTFDTCVKLLDFDLACYVYKEVKIGRIGSSFNSKDFRNKMNIRTEMIWEALSYKFTVIHTDLDVIFMKSPIPNIPCGSECHLAAIKDAATYNAGFILLHPSNYTVSIYARMKVLAESHPNMSDQHQLTDSIKKMKRKHSNFHPKLLDEDTFPNGLIFFEKPSRTFADSLGASCDECVVIHNNWIVSYEAKVYRFKEMLLWQYDGKTQYYSSRDRQYLTYDNLPPKEEDKDFPQRETEALKSALAIGIILNRTVILPKFTCSKKKKIFSCGLNSKYRVSLFNKFFNYREHVFLQHPKVPDGVKKLNNKTYAIITNLLSQHVSEAELEQLHDKHTPREPHHGATSDEIRLWFGDNTQPVLHFHSLLGAFGSFDLKSEQQHFDELTKVGISDAAYRQL